MGYVTRSQFHQCLSYLGLDSNEEEMRVMETKFFDSKGFNYLGFNYLRFLEELQPSEELEDKYQLRMTQLTAKKEQVGVEYMVTKNWKPADWLKILVLNGAFGLVLRTKTLLTTTCKNNR